MNYEKELMVAKDIARQAGVIMLEYFDGEQQVEIKSDESLVTIVDKKINSMVIRELKKHFDDTVIGEEESSGEYGMKRQWFCDPIDGTKAFVFGVPTAMFSLALVENGRPVMGVAYDPFLDRLYNAVKGEGSYCNGKQLHVSDKNIAQATVAISGKIAKLRGPHIERLLDKKIRLISLNGAVYKSCLVARGKIEGYIEVGVGGHDMAAVDLIAEEAGCLVTGLDGQILDYRELFKGAIISNRVVHDELVDSLTE